MLSAISVVGMPSLRAAPRPSAARPGGTGRVSSAKTLATLPVARGGADHAEGRAVAGGGQGARVAVGEQPRPRRDAARRPGRPCAGRPPGPRSWIASASSSRACRSARPRARAHLVEAAAHALDGPEQVDGGGPRARPARRRCARTRRAGPRPRPASGARRARCRGPRPRRWPGRRGSPCRGSPPPPRRGSGRRRYDLLRGSRRWSISTTAPSSHRRWTTDLANQITVPPRNSMPTRFDGPRARGLESAPNHVRVAVSRLGRVPARRSSGPGEPQPVRDRPAAVRRRGGEDRPRRRAARGAAHPQAPAHGVGSDADGRRLRAASSRATGSSTTSRAARPRAASATTPRSRSTR